MLKSPPPQAGRILLSGEWSKHQVIVNWDKSFHQLPPEHKAKADKLWNHIKNDHIYNGLLARLQYHSIQEDKLYLDLQASDYKTLLYSNRYAQHLLQTGQQAYLSRALGISAVIETPQNDIVYIKRSKQVGEYPEYYDMIGGHVDIANGIPDVFLSMRQEITEEIGMTDQYELKLLGLIETQHAQKPELIFQANTHLQVKEIRTYAHTAQDRFEYDHLCTCPKTELAGRVRSLSFSPSAEAGLTLYLNHITSEARC